MAIRTKSASSDTAQTTTGATFKSHFVGPKENPYSQVKWTKRSSQISGSDGKIVFAMEAAEVPESWSQLATDIVVSKYFRRAGVPKTGHETSVRQLVHRVAHTIRISGENFGGYFATAADAEQFEKELVHILLTQKGAFNSPVWFNCGLHHEYGIQGSGGNFAWDFAKGAPAETANAYEHPQCSACFIQSVDDDLMSIFDLVKNEARIFKYGSGTGTNFSKIRGSMEKLSGGGTSSGLMSFLEVLDRGAGATKSGGTTRRAAKMVSLDMDHPEIVEFINWKSREEKKVAALVEAGYPNDFNGEAYRTVSGQNSNNSVRVPDEFMEAVDRDGEWATTARTDGRTVKTFKARDLWNQISEAAWNCADPGVQFDSTIQKWHTCPETDRINGSNPCVTADTLVATTQGLRRIIDLVDVPSLIVAGDGQPSEIKGAFKTGTKQVYRLRTASGYTLKLTADHLVKTLNRGDVPAVELSKDDVIELVPAGFGHDTISSELSEILGLAVGDGCISQDILTIAMSKAERPILEKAVAFVNSLKPNRPICVTETETCVRLATNADVLTNELRKWAVLDSGSEKKAFKDSIFNLDQFSQSALLRGLFTADGTVANYGEKSQYVALDSVSLELLEQVQLLLLNFGIKSKVYRNRRALDCLSTMLPDGRGGMKEYAVLQVHSLRISRSSRLEFERKIGFMHDSEKSERLRLLNASVGAYLDRLVDKVSSIEPFGIEDVYDLTEPRTHHFVANGIVVHNCSEYMFLDDSACNLSSLNLVKFLRDDGSFDVESYRYAARILFTAQEILVDLSSYPTERIARNSHDYRPLGLGYANLGTLLMVKGIPYDSPEGLAWAGALTALMHGEAFRTSAEMAASKGPFPGYAKNASSMMRVMKQHQATLMQIDADAIPKGLMEACQSVWHEAIDLGAAHGYRNAQATVLAPTGTIGLLMDCDTTGIEPDFALVKFKKLAGGGYFKIVNQSVPKALRALGYTDKQVSEIVEYAVGSMSLENTPVINNESLKRKGLNETDLQRIATALPGAFDLHSAFAPWVLGEDGMGRAGAKNGESALKAMGFTEAQVEEVSKIVCGRMTVEGAPHLKNEHLPVFDCANKCGADGTRYLQPMSHVRMMAAAQPFLSGAISKTVNMPHEATVEDIKEVYHESWKLGLKAVAIYRDGSKLSQPLSGKSEKKKAAVATTGEPLLYTQKDMDEAIARAAALAPPRKRKMPQRREGLTIEARVGGHQVFLRTGEYNDGRIGEIFIDMHKEGATLRSLLNCFAISVSMGLQYGVPLEDFVEKFTFTRFEPYGMVDHPNIKQATSLLDYIFRVLGMEYLGKTDFVQVKPEIDKLRINGEPNTESAAQTERSFEQLDLPMERGAVPRAPVDDTEKVRLANLEAAGAQRVKFTSADPLNAQLSKMMGDAPMCSTCGHVTVRNGTCYRCLNCGNSMGCS